MEKLLLIGGILGIICLIWMIIQTKRYKVKDRFVWLVIAFFVPVPAVLIFYFTKMRTGVSSKPD